MVQDGLLLEVESLQKYLKIQADHGKVVDQTRGIWVSIGYKEFSSYLTALASDSASEKELESLEHEAIEQTKAATRQYAKRQVRWIRIKLINAASTAGIIGNVFPLDGNDLTQWADNVELPALNVAKDFLAGESLPDPVKMSPTAREMLVPKRNYDLSDRRDLWVKRTCDYCGKVMVTERDWERHVKSRGHRNAARRGMIAGASALEETR
jgi:tRNA dimethylallyltransferase